MVQPTSAPEARWVIPEVEEGLAGDIARELSCSHLLARLLVRRGVRSGSEAAGFLAPRLEHLAEPDVLPDIENAVARIERALREGERIVVFGDYDVDGVSATCLLLEFFRHIGRSVEYRLPHRLEEGYGLREESVRELAARGVDLVITVDNGSSAREAVETARTLGIDVVVTDHHEPPADPPACAAHVNPLLDATGRAFPHLAGAGVAFKLVWALCQRLSKARKLSPEFREFLVECLGLAALGTIADVVPLCGENRVLASYGLRALRDAKRPGVRALVGAALGVGGPDGGARPLEASDVAFRIAPRINAAGRLGRADQAIELLTTDCTARAAELAAALDAENRRRKEIDTAVYRSARERVLREVDLESEPAIVLGDAAWHPGVIGIVASRLAEEFWRPTLLVALDGERSRGSARSIPDVHITEALGRCASVLEGYGGHAMAAGVTLAGGRLGELRRALARAIDLAPHAMVREVEADARCSLAELDLPLLEELGRLAPHGTGNPEPLLALEGLEVAGCPRRMGRDAEHLAFHVRSAGRTVRAVAFRQGGLGDALRQGGRVALLARPKRNTWRGRAELELEVRQLRVED